MMSEVGSIRFGVHELKGPSNSLQLKKKKKDNWGKYL